MHCIRCFQALDLSEIPDDELSVVRCPTCEFEITAGDLAFINKSLTLPQPAMLGLRYVTTTVVEEEVLCTIG